MSRIRILNEQVINHIAAGEVVERPASVVKELIENSLDANATNITLNIENGGKKLIQVSDNGSGMTKDDALLSIERHATSKIYEIDDIHHISTLGFRGEALPSIAAVSEMEIITLPQNSKNQPATQIIIVGGKIKCVSEVAGNPGTIMKVKNLFANVPARKNFLKTQQTEIHHIVRNVQYLACTHYETSFRLIHNGKEILNYPKVNLLEKRIADIFGSKFFQENIIPIQKETPLISIQGYIGSFEEGANWPSTGWRNLFINNRYINNKIVYSAVRRAYEPFTKKSLSKSQLPLYIIFIRVANDQIDFNVSPTKTEVRFAEPNLVFNFVKNSITDFLLNYESQKFTEIKLEAEKSYALTGAISGSTKKQQTRGEARKLPRFSLYKGKLDEMFRPPATEFPKEKSDVQLITFFGEKIIKNKNKIVETEIVNPWQVGKSFIFVETRNGVLAIDQHAAHERVLYEQILNRLTKSSQNTEGQKLLFPLVMDLPKYLQKIIPDLIEQNLDTFKQIGFKIKVFSGNSLIIEEIPHDLHNWNNGEILLNILQELEEEYQPQMDFKKKLAQSYACHAAIKAGQKLCKKEMLALINSLFAAKNPFFCPHGRPTIIEISFNELRKRFKRI
jgi:DNA mismatch repair protein MutL